MKRPDVEAPHDVPRPEIDRRQPVAHLVRRVAAVGEVGEAELAGHVVAPALDVAVREQRAEVEEAARDRDNGGAGSEIDRGQVVAHLSRTVPARDEIALTELALRADAPALELASGEHGAGGVAGRRQGQAPWPPYPGRPPGDRCRRPPGRRRPAPAPTSNPST